MLLVVCSAMVGHEERFAQTGTGWMLRELSIGDLDVVIEFVQSHTDRFSSAGLRYATEKLPLEVKEALRAQHRRLH